MFGNYLYCVGFPAQVLAMASDILNGLDLSVQSVEEMVKRGSKDGFALKMPICVFEAGLERRRRGSGY